MLSVALCEDDELTLDIIATMVQDYGKYAHCPLRISKYTTGSMLLQELEKSDTFDIYILDYYMPFINGVEVARKLREKGENGIIIFSTSFMDGVIEAFEVNAFRYLLKPIKKETLTQVLDSAIERLRATNTSAYDIRTPDGVRKVKKDDIVFIEKNNRSLRFHLIDGNVIDSTTIQGSVKSAVSSLVDTPDFIMAGSSYAINLCRIESISHGDIVFSNGEEITPPRREMSAVKAAWDGYGVVSSPY